MRKAGAARFAAFAALAWLAPAAVAAEGQVARYGVTAEGQPVEEVTLRNARGATVRLITYGGILTAIEVPDREGHRENIVLGLPDLAGYEARNSAYYFGGVVGRYAGRIADARFEIDGEEVRLGANDGPNALHGGTGRSFIARVWELESAGDDHAVLSYSSPAGEQGFPGRLDVTLTYRLTEDDALRIDYAAQTDAPTVLNFTNHSYFNLAGADGGPVYDHRLRIFGDRIVAAGDDGIPTGGFDPVAGTLFDFREARPVGGCGAAEMPLVGGVCGYNHSWMVERDAPGALAAAARLTHPESGRVLDVFTTEPSIHVYVANHFPGTDLGAAGVPLRPHSGIALETQHLPDSPNRPEFPSTLLRPGETFRSTTIYRFGVDG